MGWQAPKADGEHREQCPVGEYVAVLIALVDLGHQETPSYDDPTQMVWKYQVACIWEVQGVADSKGEPFYFSEKYTFNVGAKANLRKLMTAAGLPAEEDDIEQLVGLPFLLTVEAAKSTKGRDYTRLAKDGGGVTKLPQVMRQHVKPPVRPPFVWRLGDESLEPYNWLPWLYDRKLHDATQASWEVTHPGEPVPEAPKAASKPAGQPKPAPTAAPPSAPAPAATAGGRPADTPAPAAAGKPPIRSPGRSPGRAPTPAAAAQTSGYVPDPHRDDEPWDQPTG
jgi:hypothetical protein